LSVTTAKKISFEFKTQSKAHVVALSKKLPSLLSTGWFPGTDSSVISQSN